jgi:hypothetical protein
MTLDKIGWLVVDKHGANMFPTGLPWQEAEDARRQAKRLSRKYHTTFRVTRKGHTIASFTDGHED